MGQPPTVRSGAFRHPADLTYDYVSQGGDDFHHHHRCAGEDATITVLMEFTRFLSQETIADVPPQDLTIDLDRIPARPATGFVVSNLRRREADSG